MATFVNKQGQRIGKVGVPDRLAANPVGENAFVPSYLGDEYPSPFLVKTAPYKFTDPFKFAEQYGAFQRQNLYKNFDAARDLALKELDTELAGLKQFVPAASALKREQVALDNPFNQAQRLAQVDFALPGVSNQLNAQSKRAEAFASGRAPDEVTDRALELGVRSRAADSAYSGGFGTGSAVARKTSDLLSAEQRIGLSQYGDQLLNSNIAAKSNLLLAPTEYSDAGSQVRVVPEVGGARLAAGAFTEINNQANIPAQTALSADINQNQFKTNLEQQTRVLNTGVQNQFALGKFQYDVGYAGAVAGAAQTDKNTQIALDQQARNEQIFSDLLSQAQQSNQSGAIASGISELITGLGGLFNSAGSLLSSSSETPVQQTPPSSGSVASEAPSPVNPVDFGEGSSTSVNTPGGVVTQPGSSIPSGDVPIASDSGGGVISVPDSGYNGPAFDSFSSDTGIGKSLINDPNQGVTKSLIQSGNATLNTAGISQTPQPGFVRGGYSEAGKPLFVSPRLQQSTDSDAGNRVINTLQKVIDPTGVLTGEDANILEKAAAVTNDAAVLNSLNTAAQNGDAKGFVDTVLGAYGQPLIASISKDPQNQAGLKSAYNAYQLYSNWDQMSPAQKGLGLAATGLQAVKFADGTDLASKSIIKPTVDSEGNVVQKGITVGDTLGLFQRGINGYSVIKNWNQLNGIQKLTGGINTVNDIGRTAQQFGLLGAGTNGAEVAGITANKLTSLGFTPTPSYGVGAIVGKPGSQVPPGYINVANDPNGGVVAIPKGTEGTAAVTPATTNVSTFQQVAGGAQVLTGALSVAQGIRQGGKEGTIQGVSGAGNIATGVDTLQGGGTILGEVGGPIALAAGAHAVYKNWGAGGAKGAFNGALGGSAMAGGLMALGATNPFLLGGVVAVSMLGGMAKTGKQAGQIQRDGVRDVFRQNGFMGKDDTITLADGTKVNLGLDGHSGEFTARNMDQIVKDPNFAGGHHTGKLHSYDIDYTNDLDYTSGMAGVALSTILTGSNSTAAKQMGGQIGNGLLGNIGNGKDMTPENFGKFQENARSVYSQAGIKTKEEAYQLANQAYAEGRMSESELITMHQGFNIVFDDNGFDTAQKLMSGRQRGAEVAMQSAPPSDNNQSSATNVSKGALVTKEAVAARNKQLFTRYSGARA